MKFGPVKPMDAIGGVAVHAIRMDSFVLKKGTRIEKSQALAMIEAGVDEVVITRLDDDDVSEDVAADAIARALAGEGVYTDQAFTGRCNLFAKQPGVLILDRDAVGRINHVDEAVTAATLPAFKAVSEGEMIATVKLIPFGIGKDLCDKAADVARSGQLSVAPYRVRRVAAISTLLPGLSSKVIDKTIAVTRERLAAAKADIIEEQRIAHDVTALTKSIDDVVASGAELVLIFGASAIADRRDVIPAAIEHAGGRIEHFGMPVDPGNLILIGEIKGVPVIGAPGCARSPKENGFDWVLARLLAGLKVTRDDITAMGVGGLLMEIVDRPQQRVSKEAPMPTRTVTAVVLAAGQSSRMGEANKLLAEVGGKPMVRLVTEQALASGASSVVVVTGHQQNNIQDALHGLNVRFTHNPSYADGLASSVKAGIAAVLVSADAAVVCLGDMPLVDAGLIDRLIGAFDPERGALIAVPSDNGRRGNPVLWARQYFRELLTLEGDVGARHLLDKYRHVVVEVPVAGKEAFTDIDTPEALADLRQT